MLCGHKIRESSPWPSHTYSMEEWIESGKQLGLKGKDLLQFFSEQQEKAREESLWSVEVSKLERAAEREHQAGQAEAQRQHEFEMRKLELELRQLPLFVDGKDDLDSYLQRFERFAKGNCWEEERWATMLSALLTGRALDVYSRMPEEAVMDYNQLKEALLKRDELTDEYLGWSSGKESRRKVKALNNLLFVWGGIWIDGSSYQEQKNLLRACLLSLWKNNSLMAVLRTYLLTWVKERHTAWNSWCR